MSTRSAPSRRAQNSSASAVAESSQCASSTTHSTVFSSAAAVSIDKRRDRHQERLDRGPVLLAERDPQRPGLRGGELLAQPHHREQQPVQGRERQRRLDLEPLGAQHQGLAGAGDQLLEQGRLADTRFTAHDQAARRPVPSLLEEPGQVRGLEVAAD